MTCSLRALPAQAARAALALAIAAPLLAAPRAHAATAGPGDTLRVWFGSESPRPPYADWRTAARAIQDAVDLADSGDCVLVRGDSTRAYADARVRCVSGCSGGARVVYSATVFPKSGVTIAGEPDGPLPILTAGDSVRAVIWPDGTRRAAIERLRFRTRGILFFGTFDTTAVVRGCVFEECHENEGGAIRTMGRGGPLIEGNLFVGNRTDSTGHHRNGGAIALNGDMPLPAPIIRNNVFRRNWAGSMGGAIRVKSAAPTIVGNLFEENLAEADGGAIAAQIARPYIDRNVFRGNRAGRSGGAVATAPGAGLKSLFAWSNEFDGNAAARGGAIALHHSGDQPVKIEITGNTFVGCRAESAGTAIYIAGTPLPAHATFINRNLFVAPRGDERPQIVCEARGGGAPVDSLACNDFFVPGKPAPRAAAGWDARCVPAPAVVAANIALDPGLVAVEGRHALGPGSPCAAERSPCGARIGAR